MRCESNNIRLSGLSQEYLRVEREHKVIIEGIKIFEVINFEKFVFDFFHFIINR